jgi:hypothetical protein
MAWGNDPTDRTHGAYNLKIVLHVSKLGATTAEVQTFLNDVLAVAGHDRVLSKLRSDFNRPWIGTDPKIVKVLGPNSWQLYPKIVVYGNLKQNRDERAVVQAIYDDAKAALVAVCEADGYTIDEVNHKVFDHNG